METTEKKFKILLLTNRDSDNLGDQVIEACDIGLIDTVMKNLGKDKEKYQIISHAAGIISKKYVATKDPDLLVNADRWIRESDMIIFGGAPLFNYKYQIFYERTATTLELAQKYNKPVIFSAIGIDGYDEFNSKCQRLKTTLNFDCVKQITTRDDFDSLKEYKTNNDIVLDKVSDPAVFASEIFKNYIVQKKSGEKKKVGIFILRANGFKDNKVGFTREDAAQMWLDVIQGLETQGYDYELLTSGHFGDEAFLDYLITRYDIPLSKCIFNMNLPEKLIGKISSYDAIISTRLHPSIIAFSLGVPAIGLIWNSKVRYFYDCIGYGDRAMEVGKVTPKDMVDKVGEIVGQKVEKDQAYLTTVYNTLFYGIRNVIEPDQQKILPYSYDELLVNIPVYEGTSNREQEEKLKRKFRRTYGKYNDQSDKLRDKKNIGSYRSRELAKEILRRFLH